MATVHSPPAESVTSGAPHCPACGSGRALRIGGFSIDDQFREYAAGDSLVHQELMRRSGLTFPSYAHLECQECGLLYSGPMQAPSGDWYSYANNTLKFHASTRWEFDFVLNGLSAADRIGEIGCGTDIFLGGAKTRGIEAQGVDFSGTSVAECARKGLAAQLVDVDLGDLQVTGDRSVIASFHVLEHLAEPAQLFAFASRWAAQDAALWIAVPSDMNMTRLKGQRDLLDEPPHHLTQWTADALRRIGAANGWRLDCLTYEQMGTRQRLWTLCTANPLYHALAGLPGLATGWPNRLLRYMLYPGLALSNWHAVRNLSGLSMLARYGRAEWANQG